ncbi:MAG: ATP-binding cassette domain-containing protein [candidate division KSB1 bacterium]|nr:ATP-binding cassette domain-containing protein [candidate division KSB1 bacterium]MDZ7273169.1 ATP-binding cassette domain-containing protein [candidate division KSB1 bacterium]MDZ7285271.1 ATP-binding cassette domain-containing protein [candidate division KSB1 bacterium]MDZ7298303.1 ATP-binding cassette domain-containing protein [candidate division KSB1 bacterium]MDZ7309615.1 ATP-binding cassette domain-containing protein [candidate division KSB1 bacterium]
MIIVNDLTVEYPVAGGVRRVLSQVSLTLAEGEFVALMGANGSGKTTLARCLNGIVTPSAGEVWVDGLNTRDPHALREIRRRVGLVFQHPDNQMVAPTVERELAFGLENLGLPRPEMQRRIAAMLELFHLSHCRERAPHQLSGGEKQRVALASIMVMQPRHLICDEPTSLLDYPARRAFFDMLARLRLPPDGGTPLTILHITQFAEEALFADRLLILHRGEIVLAGPPVDLLQRVGELAAVGLQAPVEFRAFDHLRRHGHASLPLAEVRLSPIL